MARVILHIDDGAQAMTRELRANQAHMTREECCAEVPGDEAVMMEATDYVLHYCGVECYDAWHNRCAPGLNLDHYDKY